MHGYLTDRVASADVKAALTKFLGMQTKIAQTQNVITEVDRQFTVMCADHNRVRTNLKIIPTPSEKYETFLQKFVAQDKQIDSHQSSLCELNATMQT